MTRSCIEKKVKRCLEDSFQYKAVGSKRIKAGTDFICDLGFDASDMSELLFSLDKKFGIRIRKNDKVETFGELVSSILVGVTKRQISKT